MHDWRRASYSHPAATIAQKRFGSWTAFLTAGGTKPGAGSRSAKKHDRFAPWWTKQRVADAMVDFAVREGRWPTRVDWKRADPDGRWPAAIQVRMIFGGWLKAQVWAGRPKTPVLMRRMSVRPDVRREPMKKVAA